MEKVTSKDGTLIAFDKLGQGPALILVGGAFQYRAFDQRTAHLAELLAKDFTIYHYDRRGRGDSGDTLPYAVEREVEDLDALIKQAGGSAFVYGMSSGAVLALLAASRGLKIKKLALYEPPFGNASAGVNYARQLDALLSDGRRGDAVEFAMKTFGTPAEAVSGMRQAPEWRMFESVAPTLAYDAVVMGDGSVPTDVAQAVTLPTLVLDGGASPAWMRNAAQAVADALPNAKRRTLEGQTHAVVPEVLAPVLAEFFKR